MKNSGQKKGQAVLSIHDVAPEHLPVVVDILSDLAARSVPAVNFAIIPFFHQRDRWDKSSHVLKAAVSPSSAIRTEVLLHGYYHRRIGPNERLPWMNSILSRLQSSHEDEFFGLDLSEAAERIRKGKKVLEDVFGWTSRGFIPPAWAGAQGLRDVLRAIGFRYTEDHFWIYDLETGRRIPSPIIAFSSRNPCRKTLSFLWARIVQRISSPDRILRFVLHPTDYCSRKTRDIALSLIAELSETYDWCLSEEVLESRNDRS